MEFTKEQMDQINKMIEEKQKTPQPNKDPKPEETKPTETDKEIIQAEKELKLKKIKKEIKDLDKEPEEKEQEGGLVINGDSTGTEEATDEDWKAVSELTK